VHSVSPASRQAAGKPQDARSAGLGDSRLGDVPVVLPVSLGHPKAMAALCDDGAPLAAAMNRRGHARGRGGSGFLALPL
jgi:hypothetical protein